MTGVPAACSVVAVASTDREALGAAYLVAEQFCEWAMRQLKT